MMPPTLTSSDAAVGAGDDLAPAAVEPAKPIRPDTPTVDAKRMLTLEGCSPIQLNLTTGRIMKAKAKGMDIGNIETGILGNMFLDPLQLGEIVWLLFEDRIVAAGIADADAFYDAIDGAANRQMHEGMKAAVRDFFTWGEGFIENVEELLDGIKDSMRKTRVEMETDLIETPVSSTPSSNAQASPE